MQRSTLRCACQSVQRISQFNCYTCPVENVDYLSVAKKASAMELNDFCPITPTIMKCFERITWYRLLKQTEGKPDLLQFAHKRNVGVEVAILF